MWSRFIFSAASLGAEASGAKIRRISDPGPASWFGQRHTQSNAAIDFHE